MDAGKWYQVGNPFVELKDGQVATLNTAFGQGFSDGDQVYIYNPETNGYDGPYEWMTSREGTVGWTNLADGALCSAELAPGQAVFIHKKTAGAVPVAGAVSETTACSFGTESGSSWAQVVCVYPVARALNGMRWANIAEGDQVYIYNPETNGYDGPYEWMTSREGTVGWTNLADGALSSAELTPGRAMFINKKSAGSATLLPSVPSK